MKKITLTALLLLAIFPSVFSQFYMHPTNGRVGIGTTAPAGNLHLYGTNTYLILEKSAASYENVIQYRRAGTVLFTVGTDVTSDAYKIRATGLTGETNVLPRLEMPLTNKNILLGLSGGFVGIGTNAPSEVLDVNGGFRIRTLAQDNAQTRFLMADATGKVFWRDASSVSTAGDNLGNHIVTQSIVPNAVNSFDLGSVTNSMRDAYFAGKFFLDDRSFINADWNTTFGCTGNTGIGHYTLTDITTGYFNTSLGFGSLENTTTGISNTAIGHQSMQFNINGNENTALGLDALYKNISGNRNTGVGYWALFENNSGSENTALGNFAGFSNVNGSGNVFLGNNSGYNETGSNKLYIDNTSTVSPLIYGDFNLNKLTFNSEVGIGVLNPTEKLEVLGTARFSVVAQDNSLSRIMAMDNTGKIFWRDITSISGGDNLGNHQATQNIVATLSTIDLGTSMQGFRNLYLSSALYMQGSQFLRNYNGGVIMGAGAGNSLTSGSNNTFLGNNAGQATATTHHNTFVGTNSGYKNTGYQNTFLGYGTGMENLGGINNTYVGLQAGFSNATGSYNTVLGMNGGYHNTGSYNTYIGAQAGYRTVGSNNIFIGYNSNIAEIALDNAVAIGSNAYVAVSNGFVLGNNSHKVGIRNSSPAYALHVQNAYCDGNTWFNSSDRNLKENFRSLNNEGVLEKVMNLKIQKWNYIGDSGAAHIGPTAQDFYETFRLGVNEKVIASVDEAGVALAAIQELNRKTEQLEKTVQEQQQIISSLLQGRMAASESEGVQNINGVKLHQNAPNPFRKETKIAMELPESVIEAVLYIYDMNGKALEEHRISNRGMTSITIEGGKFSSGIYLYALIADGQASDIKRMILTN
jgi:hypothetical protein